MARCSSVSPDGQAAFSRASEVPPPKPAYAASIETRADQPRGATPSARVTLAVALIALSGAWNAGTVGPVASEIGAEFEVSLAVVGLLAGTAFLGTIVIGLLFASQVGERTGLVGGLRLSCVLLVAGNLLFAVSPIFAGLVVGRILPGLGFALVSTLGPFWARSAGGVRLVGVFGASIQLGLALALLVGSGLADLGVDWRVGFGVAAALGAAAYVAIPASASVPSPPEQRSSGFVRAALGHLRAYRLALLFISIYGVPMILSAWMIEYLSSDGDVTASVAGAAAFLLFGLSAAVRWYGARLQQRGVPHALLGAALALASIGMAGLALDPVAAMAFAAAVLLSVGFGTPYATALTEAQDLWPDEPAEPLALMTLAALIPPIVAIPVMGHMLANGDGDLAFAALAVFLALATLANLRRTGIPLAPASPGEERA